MREAAVSRLLSGVHRKVGSDRAGLARLIGREAD
jgi:hypothetical protein